ncbi:MAG: cation:proton antiporter [Methanobrevibacter sp.]|jgi:energy-converting hydrogenase B subunit C|nr:cation:proton antiporter [Methanobrevibacter sp.]
MINIPFDIIQSLCLIISSILILITCIGILRFQDDRDKIIYVRIQLLGIVDIAGVLAMIGLDQLLLAGIYFILCPIVAHTMANAYYYSKEDHNKESLLNDDDKIVNGNEK